MYDNYSLSKRLIQLRTQVGISQEKLAEEADISAKYVSQIERGIKNPTVKTISKICEALGVSMSEFFSNEINEESSSVTADRINLFLSKRTDEEKKSLEQFLKLLEQCIKEG